jgi:hypothetical protein
VSESLAGAGYDESRRVTVGGRPRLRVFERDARPTAKAPIPVEAAVARFDARADARFEPGLPYAFELGRLPNTSGAVLAGLARLEGYAIDRSVRAGDELVVTLYWRGLAPMVKDYSAFAHLVATGDDTRVAAQSDGAPGWCGDIAPTTAWQPGRIVVDRRVLEVPLDTPPGRYSVRVGMYNYETLVRLPLLGPSGQVEGDHVPLGDVVVRPRT